MLAALINALSLIAVAFFIFYEAFKRWQSPEQVHAGTMIGVAAAGVVIAEPVNGPVLAEPAMTMPAPSRV